MPEADIRHEVREVCFWPRATEIDVRLHVGDRGRSGLVVLSLSFVAFDQGEDNDVN